MRRLAWALLAAAIAGAQPVAQDVSLEYRVKAAFLYNFVKFIEWPEYPAGRLRICVAGQNPFGPVLDDLTRNERVRGVPLESTVILEARRECEVLFTPRTSSIPVYLRAVADAPTLTVGETPGFLEQGGMIRFFLDGINVRFEINRTAVERARLRISARLLQLSRSAEAEAEER